MKMSAGRRCGYSRAPEQGRGPTTTPPRNGQYHRADADFARGGLRPWYDTERACKDGAGGHSEFHPATVDLVGVLPPNLRRKTRRTRYSTVTVHADRSSSDVRHVIGR